jgi:hypothetical protein
MSGGEAQDLSLYIGGVNRSWEKLLKCYNVALAANPAVSHHRYNSSVPV